MTSKCSIIELVQIFLKYEQLNSVAFLHKLCQSIQYFDYSK